MAFCMDARSDYKGDVYRSFWVSPASKYGKGRGWIHCQEVLKWNIFMKLKIEELNSKISGTINMGHKVILWKVTNMAKASGFSLGFGFIKIYAIVFKFYSEF